METFRLGALLFDFDCRNYEALVNTLTSPLHLFFRNPAPTLWCPLLPSCSMLYLT